MSGIDPVSYGKLLGAVDALTSKVGDLEDQISEDFVRIDERLDELQKRLENVESFLTAGRGLLLGVMFGLGMLVYGAKDAFMRLVGAK